MSQRTRTFALSLASLVVLVAPTAANAWPFGKALHLHPRTANEKDARVTIHLFNKGDHFQEVSVAGRIYTVMQHEGLDITAPAGTDILAGTANVYHRKGDVLFSITPALKECTVSFE